MLFEPGTKFECNLMTRDDNASLSETKSEADAAIPDSGNQLTNLTILTKLTKFTRANRLSKKNFKRKYTNFSSCVYFNFIARLNFLIVNYKIFRLLFDKFIIYNFYHIKYTEIGNKISMKLTRSRDCLCKYRKSRDLLNFILILFPISDYFV